MKAQPVTVVVTFLLLTFSLSRAADADPKHEQFKQEMLPKVGERITFVGSVTPGKFGPYLTSDHWVGIYIEATTTNRADLAKLNTIDREQGHMLKVVGVLHFTQGHPGQIIDGVQVAGVPEHFFFDVAEVSFSETRVRPDEKPNK